MTMKRDRQPWDAPMYHREGPVSYVRTDEAARRVAVAFEDGKREGLAEAAVLFNYAQAAE